MTMPMPPPTPVPSPDHAPAFWYADRMTIQIAVRLPSELLAGVDRLVERGRFANRTDAVRGALGRPGAASREAELDAAIVAGYRALPDDHELDAWAQASLRA